MSVLSFLLPVDTNCSPLHYGEPEGKKIFNYVQISFFDYDGKITRMKGRDRKKHGTGKVQLRETELPVK